MVPRYNQDLGEVPRAQEITIVSVSVGSFSNSTAPVMKFSKLFCYIALLVTTQRVCSCAD